MATPLASGPTPAAPRNPRKSASPRPQALLSARADPTHCFADLAEVRVREALRELLLDGREIDGRGLAEALEADVGQHGERGSRVGRVDLASNQAGRRQLVDHSAHPCAAQYDEVAELRHR